MTNNPFSSENLLPQLSNYPISKGGVGSGRYPKGSGENPGRSMSGANLSRAYLPSADLREAFLHRANLNGADLSNADLREANLNSSNLRGANLTNANLTNADLRGANLTNAKLINADLRGADLSFANLNKTNLNGAKADEYTKLPDTHEVINGFIVKRIFGKSRITKGGEGSGRYPKGSGKELPYIDDSFRDIKIEGLPYDKVVSLVADEAGADEKAVDIFLADNTSDYETVGDAVLAFDDAYFGHYDSDEDFLQSVSESTGLDFSGVDVDYNFYHEDGYYFHR